MLCVMNPSVKNSGQPRITLRMIFEHVQNLSQRMGDMEQSLRESINRVEKKVDRNHLQVMSQLDTIDSRLDHLEVVEMPKVKRTIGIR